MKNIRRKMAGLLTFVLAIVSLASCTKFESKDNKDPEPQNPTDPTNPQQPVDPGEDTSLIYDGKPVEIEFCTTASETKLKPIIDAFVNGGEEGFEDICFKHYYPNITVNLTHADGYDALRDAISTKLPTDNQPDLAYCYADHVALYNKSKKTVPFDAYMTSKSNSVTGTFNIADATYSQGIVGFTQEQEEDFIPGFYAEGRKIGGFDKNGVEDTSMYALPFLKSTEIMFYNKTFFETNHLTVPTTWDELETVCRQIKAIDPTCVPLGYDSGANWFITMCEQGKYPYTTSNKSEGYFLFDNAQNRAFVKRFAKLYQEGLVTTAKASNIGYCSSYFVNQSTAEGEIRSYLCIGSSAGASNQCPKPDGTGAYPFEVGCAQIPQLDKANPKVISQGPSICMFRHTKVAKDVDNRRLAASWLLLKFLLTNVFFQTEFSLKSGYVPSIKSVNDYPVYTDAIAKADGNAFLATLANKFCLSQADYYYTSPAFVGSSDARVEVEGILTGVFTGSILDGSPISDSALDSLIDTKFKTAIQTCRYNAGL